MPNLDELTHDMTFIVGGETFKVHDISPDVLMGMESDIAAEEAGDEPAMKRVDDQILAFLNGDQDQVSRYKALRAREENPVPLWRILEFRRLLWETQTDRPTNPPAPLPIGRGRTAPTSEAA